MKTKIFIDFDGTIFDTDSFRILTWNAFAKAGFSYARIEKTYAAACSDYKYSPQKQLELLARQEQGDKTTALYLVSQLYLHAPKMIFADAISFLGGVDRAMFQVNLLSMGDQDFQRAKIESSLVSNFFDNVYITDEQKWTYLDRLVDVPDQFIFIDDRSDTVHNMARKFINSLSIEINRIGLPSDPMEPVVEFGNVAISSFNQLGLIINKFKSVGA